MRRIIYTSLFAMVVLMTVSAVAHEIPIETPVQVHVEAGKAVERNVALIFDDLDLSVKDRTSRDVLLKLEFSKITRNTYEFSVQPKVLQAASVTAPSAEQRHWLTIYYQQDGQPAYLLLALDKYDFEDVVTVTGIITEKEVEGAPGQ